MRYIPEKIFKNVEAVVVFLQNEFQLTGIYPTRTGQHLPANAVNKIGIG